MQVVDGTGLTSQLTTLVSILCLVYTTKKTNMTMQIQPFEDVSRVKENGDVPLSC